MDVKEINIVGNKLVIDGKSLDNLPVCSYEMKSGDAKKRYCRAHHYRTTDKYRY